MLNASPFFTYADGGDDGNAAAFYQPFNQTGIDAFHRTDLSDVHAILFGRIDQKFLRLNEMVVAPAHADRVPSICVNHRHDFLVDVPAQYHFDNIHRLFVGNAHSLDKFALFADFFKHRIDLRPPP